MLAINVCNHTGNVIVQLSCTDIDSAFHEVNQTIADYQDEYTTGVLRRMYQANRRAAVEGTVQELAAIVAYDSLETMRKKQNAKKEK